MNAVRLPIFGLAGILLVAGVIPLPSGSAWSYTALLVGSITAGLLAWRGVDLFAFASGGLLWFMAVGVFILNRPSPELLAIAFPLLVAFGALWTRRRVVRTLLERNGTYSTKPEQLSTEATNPRDVLLGALRRLRTSGIPGRV